MNVISKKQSGKSPGPPGPPWTSIPDWATDAPQPEAEPEAIEVPEEADAPAAVDHWQDIDDEARAYLTGPRNYPAPCMWCGGRLVHNRHCDELRLSWLPSMPFGVHKGKLIAELPSSYLHYLRGLRIDDDELKAQVDAEWKRRTTPTRNTNG